MLKIGLGIRARHSNEAIFLKNGRINACIYCSLFSSTMAEHAYSPVEVNEAVDWEDNELNGKRERKWKETAMQF